MFLVSQFTITRPRIPKIGTYDAFINAYVKSKFQLSRFYRLLVISKINPHLPKFANKNKSTHAHVKSLLQSKWLTTLLCEDYLQTIFTNVIDLKPVPIIRFKFQFGFQIVWFSDPSGFDILKCPSL